MRGYIRSRKILAVVIIGVGLLGLTFTFLVSKGTFFAYDIKSEPNEFGGGVGAQDVTTYYVKPDGNDCDDPGCGESWSNAFATVGKAVSKVVSTTAPPTTRIFVAEGTYDTNIIINTNGQFNTGIYGGFKVGEEDTNNRTGASTIFDGGSAGSIIRNYADSNGTRKMKIDRVTMANGKVTGKGGSIRIYYGDLTLNDVIIKDSFAVGDYGIGGAIYAFKTNLEISNSQISSARADQEGGGIYFHGSDSKNININNSQITDCLSATNGGGVYVRSVNDISISHSKIAENSAHVGAGLYINGAAYNDKFTIDHNLIKHNKAIGKIINGEYFLSTGGGVYLNSIISSDTSIKDRSVFVNQIIDNTADNSSAIHMAAAVFLSFQSNIIAGNHSAGGGIINFGNSANSYFINNTITGNRVSPESLDNDHNLEEPSVPVQIAEDSAVILLAIKTDQEEVYFKLYNNQITNNTTAYVMFREGEEEESVNHIKSTDCVGNNYASSVLTKQTNRQSDLMQSCGSDNSRNFFQPAGYYAFYWGTDYLVDYALAPSVLDEQGGEVANPNINTGFSDADPNVSGNEIEQLSKDFDILDNPRKVTEYDIGAFEYQNIDQQVVLEGWRGQNQLVGQSKRLLQVTVKDSTTGEEIYTGEVPQARNGYYLLNPVWDQPNLFLKGELKNHDIYLKANGYLAKKVHVGADGLLANSYTDLSTVLLAGDTNNDNQIDVKDFVDVLLNFGSTVTEGTNGDIDGDEVATVIDLNLILLNFDVAGD